MERESLNYVLHEQQRDFKEREDLVDRKITSRLIKYLPLKMPIVITGVRRCGKSSLLKIIKNKLKLKEKDYLYINLNDERLTNFTISDFQKILDYLDEMEYQKNCVLFIDEIQEVKGWEKWIDRIRTKHNIFLTGSNSKLLSKEISTVLTGRSISVTLFPFSFEEYLSYKKIDLNDWKHNLKIQAEIRKEFRNYIESGGFPQRVITGHNIIVSELYQNILYRDIIGRFNKRLTKSIKEISLFLLSNVSSNVSLRTLSNISQVTNLSTVKEILDSFENAFLFFSTSKYDCSIKKQTQSPKKVYCIDNGFAANLGFKFSEDKGKLLKNFVAIELGRRNKEIYYHKEKRECDFLIKEHTKIKSAVQVTFALDRHNITREIEGVKEAMIKFKLKEGLILTLDEENLIKHNGLKIVVTPAWKWLLMSK